MVKKSQRCRLFAIIKHGKNQPSGLVCRKKTAKLQTIKNAITI